ncbi:MAG: tryptophan synthase subunit alpha [bacterium]|nr:tryptophan synthase subunit alpha [bacterium]
MNLTEYIREKRKTKDLLCMAHLVCGYPDLATNREVIRIMVERGVDLIELQIPFSEPIADGPTILAANQLSLQRGTRIRDCLSLMEEVSSQYPIPFLFMTYYNILFSRGVDTFVKQAQQTGGVGLIIPDVPPEEGEEYLTACRTYHLSPILLMTPTSSLERLRLIAEAGDGFFYCVARKGVTGAKTYLSKETDEFIQRCRKVTDLPLAMGLGISSREDFDYLAGKVDIAVIGSAIIRIFEQGGYQALTSFLEKLIIGIS